MSLILDLSPFWDTVLSWLPYSLAFWLLGRKLNWQQLWQVLIPGAGYLKLGQTLDMERDGVLCFVMNILTTVIALLPTERFTERVQIGLALLLLILVVLLFVCRIRLGVRLLAYFRMKRVWILLWIFFPWVLLMIMALSTWWTA